MTFQIGNLLFESKDDYLFYKSIDDHIKETAKLVEKEKINTKEFFDRIEDITVTECCYDAREELDGLFPNAIDLLKYEKTRFNPSYKLAKYFFRKIKVYEYESGSETETETETETESEEEME